MEGNGGCKTGNTAVPEQPPGRQGSPAFSRANAVGRRTPRGTLPSGPHTHNTFMVFHVSSALRRSRARA